jgi:hypothetical protein
MAKKLDLREAMPVTAALIDDFRAAFGVANINDVIRRGMAGEPVFHATENGHVVGTPVPVGIRVGINEGGNRCLVDGSLPGESVEQNEGRGRRKPLNNQNWGKK